MNDSGVPNHERPHVVLRKTVFFNYPVVGTERLGAMGIQIPWEPAGAVSKPQGSSAMASVPIAPEISQRLEFVASKEFAASQWISDSWMSTW